VGLAEHGNEDGGVQPDHATNVVAEGDQVVAEWTSRAVTRFGEAYENFCLGVFTVRDGKIISVREYMDTLRAKNVLFAQAPADVPATGR
jgi:ketosteroid isomerase-like protein